MSKITLLKPDAGETAHCTVQHGHVYVFDFDSSDATFDRVNGALKISFEDGSQLLLQDFYTETLIADLFIELPDGARVSGRELAEAMEFMPEDFQTDSGTSIAMDSQNFQAESSGHMLQAGAESMYTTPGAKLFGLNELQHGGTLGFRNYPQMLAEHADTGKDELHSEHHTDSSTIFFPGREEVVNFAASEPADDLVLSAFFVPQVEEGSLSGNGQISASVDKPVSLFTEFSDKTPVSSPVSTDNSRFYPAESKSGSLLVLEDLLDTSLQEFASAKHPPAFADIFHPSPDDGISMRPTGYSLAELELSTTVSAEPGDECSDQLLLAFLSMSMGTSM